VTASERHRRHGHYPGLIVVEDDPDFATRLERALFDDHFEVLLITGDSLPVSALQNQLAVFESAGLIVIYSTVALDPEMKRKLAGLMANRFFDLSALELPIDQREAMQKVLRALRLLRTMVDAKHKDPID
jgi:hypothetical protein